MQTMSKCDRRRTSTSAWTSRAPINKTGTRCFLGAWLSQPMEARTRAPYVCRTLRLASRVCSSQVVRFCGRDAAAAARPYRVRTSVFPVTARRTFPQLLRKSKRMAGWRWVWCCCQKRDGEERLSSCGVSLPNANYIP